LFGRAWVWAGLWGRPLTIAPGGGWGVPWLEMLYYELSVVDAGRGKSQ
jgi:hypothetical protein